MHAVQVAPDAISEIEVLEETGPKPYLADEDMSSDPLSGMDNAEAVEALKVVKALKLSKQELAEGLVPEVGCASPHGSTTLHASRCMHICCLLFVLGFGFGERCACCRVSGCTIMCTGQSYSNC